MNRRKLARPRLPVTPLTGRDLKTQEVAMRSPKEMFVVEPDRVVAELPQGEAQLKTLLKIGLVLPAGDKLDITPMAALVTKLAREIFEELLKKALDHRAAVKAGKEDLEQYLALAAEFDARRQKRGADIDACSNKIDACRKELDALRTKVEASRKDLEARVFALMATRGNA